MNNFYYYNPTNIIFGENVVKNITKEIPLNKKILLIYGQSSIKKNGIYDNILNVLRNYKIYEFGGITPNPEYEKCVEAVKIIKKEKIDFLLAIGGGSVIDATKFISLAANYNGNPWDFMKDKTKTPNKAIDFGTIVTISGSGAEMNNAFVISNKKTNEKLVGSSFFTYPKFSVLDVNFTKSLSKEQIINGFIDTYVHILEQYITKKHNNINQEYLAEAYLKSLLKISQTLSKKWDKESYKNFMWISAQVSSGILSRGVPVDWSTHEIAHQITALTNLTHAKTLAIVLFGVWENQLEYKKEKLIRYAKEVFQCNLNGNEAAKFAIKKTEELFLNLGVKTRFSDYNLDGKKLAQKISEYFQKTNKTLGENKSITHKEIKEILLSRI